MADAVLKIPLSDTQARLYMESSYFRASVDTFLVTIVPTFLEGAEKQASRMDDLAQEKIEEAMRHGGFFQYDPLDYYPSDDE